MSPSVYTAMERIPMARSVDAMRTAISPRFAIKTLCNVT
ncbi:hypothetical protein L833_3165 [Mycobacteroides abscessus MAB_091912_2446]|uniref:Uncharacterized protein n=1 Tax=Mycobacteroides abscessus MAB_091912_2446 TaxID=1335414 RepID=A0A829MNK4_9MYCO|nr:hypothetical protein L833_3165 [Mycobacteroides abscessus MAB_091912_2446]